MIYLDNAATGFFKPKTVLEKVAFSLEYLSANPGRGGHELSLKVASAVHKTRRTLSEFLELPCGNIVFTLNCSHALNFAINGLLAFRQHSHVVCSCYEHNSVLRPLNTLAKNGQIKLTILPPTLNGGVCPKAIEQSLQKDTRLVITNHVSNVTGGITPIFEIGKICRKNGVPYLVDAAQSAGHIDIDMTKNNVDMLALAPHKGLYAPQGIGVLAVRNGIAPLIPQLSGGTGTDSTTLSQPFELPESHEIGTLPTPAIAGLLAGLNWTKENLDTINTKTKDLFDLGLTELKKINGVNIYTAKNNCNSILSFNIGNMHSSEVAEILSNEYSICVRGGLHCAPLIHEYLGTLGQGIVRASIGFNNEIADIEKLIWAVKDIAGKFGGKF